MPRDPDFRSTVISLWFRLITLGIVAMMFSEGLMLAQGTAQGWAFYLTLPEVAFEVAVRLIAAALAGVVLGTACTAVLASFLWYFKSSRERVADGATKFAVVLVVFLVSWYALEILIKWSQHFSHRSTRFYVAVHAAYFLAFAAALCIPRGRRQIVTSLDGVLTESMTRRTALATVIGTAALVTTEFVLSKTAPALKAALPPQRPKSNFLLITFDALSAEDMSLYGYGLPTTPNIEAFARQGTVFTNFYSASTFTTPSVATMMTGFYPSESYVYQLSGQVGAKNAGKSLPHLMNQTRPVIHVPLIVRTPGQQDSRRVAFNADPTALAPTILELAGQRRPDWMRGQSLVPWLDRDGQGEGQGLAFCQYLEKNSIFKPQRHGTVGVIDGQYQYVVHLDTQKGDLRPLSQAQIWNVDRSAENPARAEALRAAVHSRFPGLIQVTT